MWKNLFGQPNSSSENNSAKKSKRQQNYLMVLVGGYLIYLGGKMIKGLKGEDVQNPIVSIIFAVMFIVVGILVIVREWKVYKALQAERERMAEETEEPDEPYEPDEEYELTEDGTEEILYATDEVMEETLPVTDDDNEDDGV